MQELALFVTAFLAATILPFSSEAAFLVAISNDTPTLNAMIFASSGNVLAIIFNYYLGYFLYEKSKTKLLSSKIKKSHKILIAQDVTPSGAKESKKLSQLLIDIIKLPEADCDLFND